MPASGPSCDPLVESEYRLLAEIGFVAASRGWLGQARQIFAVLMELAPQRVLPHIGLALALLNAQCADEAVRHLECVLGLFDRALIGGGQTATDGRASDRVSDPHDESALIRAYYGVALKLSGRTSESFRILRGLTDRPAADNAGRIARSMLGLPHPQEA